MQTPATIGPYRLLEQIGGGGMGVVFRVEDEKSGEYAALKTVKANATRFLDGIRREMHALAAIDHPGVVRIVEHGMHDGHPWYAMELLQGLTLREYQRRIHRRIVESFETLPVPEEDVVRFEQEGGSTRPSPDRAPAADPKRMTEILTLFRDLCAPLSFVHGEGLVHCDLKPENVFLRAQNTPVLMDFGLISRLSGDVARELLDVEVFMGTAEYMSPEQWERRPPDARADVYALGCMLFETLTGTPPFVGPRALLRQAHLDVEAPRLSEYIRNTPEALDHLLAKLLAKRPRDRIGHADEIARRLEEIGGLPRASTAQPPRPYLYRPEISGRAATIKEIESLLQADEAAPFVVLIGESGVGKTRIAVEFARTAKRLRLPVITGECAPPGSGATAGPRPVEAVLDYVADLCLEHSRVAEKISGERASVLAKVFPRMRQIPGLNVEEVAPLDAQGETERLLRCLREAFAISVEDEAALLVIDDIQWVDQITLSLLNHFAQHRSRWPKLRILATCRSEESNLQTADLVARDAVKTVAVDRLDAASIEEMVFDMLGAPAPSPFVRALSSESEGNPFFIAEYLRALVAEQALRRDAEGHWEVADAGEDWTDLQLPSTIHDLILRRVGGLTQDAQRLFEVLAAIGRVAEVSVLVSASGWSESRARDALQELLARQIIEDDKDAQVRISHDKLREVVHAELEAGRRMDVHSRIADALSKHDSVDSATIALHLVEGGRPQEALPHLEAAATAALSNGRHRQAKRHLEQALQLTRDDDDPVVRARWRRQLSDAHFAGGALEESRAAAVRSLEALGARLPSSRTGWAGRLFWEFGRQLAHRLIDPARRRTPEQSAVLQQTTLATGTLARLAFFENDPLKTVATSFWSVNEAESAGHLHHAARNYSGLGWIFGMSTLHKVADSYFARARSVAEAHQDFAGMVFSLTSEALYRTGRGEFEVALHRLETARTWCERTGNPQDTELVDILCAHPHYFMGDFQRSLECSRSVEASARLRDNAQHTAWGLYCSARAEIAMGRIDDAVRNLEAASERIDRAGDELSALAVDGLMARAYLRCDRLADADAAAARAQAIIQSGQPPVFLALHGYSGIVVVNLARLRRTKAKDDHRLAVRSVRALGRFARTFPVARPEAALARATLARIEGKTARGERWSGKAAEAAVQLSMEPFVEMARREFEEKAPVTGAEP